MNARRRQTRDAAETVDDAVDTAVDTVDDAAAADTVEDGTMTAEDWDEDVEVALDLHQLVKTYGSAAAVGPVDLRVPAGQSVLLVGHNGSGKSTLLGMVAGVLEPTSGSVEVFEVEPTSLTGRATISYLPDTPVLYDDLSVDEHLQYVSRMHGGEGTGPEIDALVERLGLAARRDELPSRFSRGLRQRTAIALALCRPFGLLLVDEPFVGLDEEGRDAFVSLLDDAHRRGATVVVATHDPARLEHFDRRVELSDGAFVGDTHGPRGRDASSTPEERSKPEEGSKADGSSKRNGTRARDRARR
jgi:ABC-type multidrug transport system ATPase subunit